MSSPNVLFRQFYWHYYPMLSDFFRQIATSTFRIIFNPFLLLFWLWTGERNIQGMLAKLEPLHAMLERGPQTLKETSFHQAYGNDLNEAKRWCSRYKMSANIRDLNQAWDLYYHVFRRISRQLPQLTQLELQYVSPKLLMCRDLELAVPVSHINFTIFFCNCCAYF